MNYIDKKVRECGNNIGQFKDIIAELRIAIFLKKNIKNIFNDDEIVSSFRTGAGPDFLIENNTKKIKMFWETRQLMKHDNDRSILKAVQTTLDERGFGWRYNVYIDPDVSFQEPSSLSRLRNESAIALAIEDLKKRFPTDVNEPGIFTAVSNNRPIFQVELISRSARPEFMSCIFCLKGDVAFLETPEIEMAWVKKIRNTIEDKCTQARKASVGVNDLSFIVIICPEDMSVLDVYSMGACWGREQPWGNGVAVPRLQSMTGSSWQSYLLENGLIQGETLRFVPFEPLDGKELEFGLDGAFANPDIAVDGVLFSQNSIGLRSFWPNPRLENEVYCGILTKMQDKFTGRIPPFI